jgi:peptidoglycan/LPS O-acetylase OafA/YrhL
MVAATAIWFGGEAIRDGTSAGFGVLTFNPLLRLPEFVLGMIAGVVFIQKQPLVRTLSPYAGRLALLVGAGVVLLMAESHQIPRVLLQGPVLLPFWAALIFLLACIPDEGISLAHPWMQWAGKRSYALYLIHQPVYWYGVGLGSVVGVTIVGSWSLLTLYVVACWVLAALVHDRLELRLRGPLTARLNAWCLGTGRGRAVAGAVGGRWMSGGGAAPRHVQAMGAGISRQASPD